MFSNLFEIQNGRQLSPVFKGGSPLHSGPFVSPLFPNKQFRAQTKGLLFIAIEMPTATGLPL